MTHQKAEGPPAGLSIAELFDGDHCKWVIYTKAKRGPNKRGFCRTCRFFGKKPVCDTPAGRAAFSQEEGR